MTSRPRTILLIDPDQQDLEEARKTLERSGFVVHSARDANDALSQLGQQVEQKSAELASLQKEHARAEKLAALGTLLAGVVHEIGSPLTVLEANLPDLFTASPQDQAEMLADMKAATSRISRLHQTLRRLSRVNEPRGWSELAPAIAESKLLVKERLPPQVKVEWAIDSSVTQVYLGHDDLVSVLTNLIINAGHALEEKPAGTVRVSLERTGPRAVLSVRDDGCGIKPEHLERVLDPFFTTKPKGKGTGLGLSLVDQVIRTAGGSLSVESTLGVGTTISAVLRII